MKINENHSRQDLMERLKIPQSVEKYLDLVFNEGDLQIIDASDDKGYIVPGLFPNELMDMAYRRGIVNKEITNGQEGYRITDFYTRLEYFMLEDQNRWKTLPDQVKKDLDYWYVDEYARKILKVAEEKGVFQTEEILPLEMAAEKIINTSEDIVIHDCDCRLFAEGCEKSINVCIHFSSNKANSVFNRGYGRVVSKEEALAILKKTDEEGLIHNSGHGAICNCCTCCCYPLRSALSHGTKDKWPQTHYIASIDQDLCMNCGACVSRCYFGALQTGFETMELNEDKCWGCGVCRSVCPTNAIQINHK